MEDIESDARWEGEPVTSADGLHTSIGVFDTVMDEHSTVFLVCPVLEAGARQQPLQAITDRNKCQAEFPGIHLIQE